jgi:hypothetical protein
MKIANNKNNCVVDTDEVHNIYKTKNGYANTFDICFCFKRYSSSINWSFKTQEERDKVFELLKNKIGIIEINDTDLSI